MTRISAVLVVDSDPQGRESLVYGFEGEGYDATASADPSSVTELLARTKPAVVVVAVREVGAPALALLRQLREQHPAVPVLALGVPAARDEIRAVGGVDFLPLPVFVRDVITACKLLVALRAAVGEAAEGDLHGALSEYGLYYLVRTMVGLGRSGIVQVERANRRGEVRFSDGQVTAAQVGSLQGAAALHHLLLWEEAALEIRFRANVRRGQLHKRPQELLDEAERFLRDFAHSTKDLGSTKALLVADEAKAAQTPDAVPVEVAPILRLCDGKRTLGELIEDSPFRVFETVRILTRLLDIGVLSRKELPAAQAADAPQPRAPAADLLEGTAPRIALESTTVPRAGDSAKARGPAEEKPAARPPGEEAPGAAASPPPAPTPERIAASAPASIPAPPAATPAEAGKPEIPGSSLKDHRVGAANRRKPRRGHTGEHGTVPAAAARRGRDGRPMPAGGGPPARAAGVIEVKANGELRAGRRDLPAVGSAPSFVIDLGPSELVGAAPPVQPVPPPVTVAPPLPISVPAAARPVDPAANIPTPPPAAVAPMGAIPSAYVPPASDDSITALPVTTNGSLDRAAGPRAGVITPAPAVLSASRTPASPATGAEAPQTAAGSIHLDPALMAELDAIEMANTPPTPPPVLTSPVSPRAPLPATPAGEASFSPLPPTRATIAPRSPFTATFGVVGTGAAGRVAAEATSPDRPGPLVGQGIVSFVRNGIAPVNATTPPEAPAAPLVTVPPVPATASIAATPPIASILPAAAEPRPRAQRRGTTGEFSAIEADFFARESDIYKEETNESFEDLDGRRR